MIEIRSDAVQQTYDPCYIDFKLYFELSTVALFIVQEAFCIFPVWGVCLLQGIRARESICTTLPKR